MPTLYSIPPEPSKSKLAKDKPNPLIAQKNSLYDIKEKNSSGNHTPISKTNPTNDPLKTFFQILPSFFKVNWDNPNHPLLVAFRFAASSAILSPLRCIIREQKTIKIFGQIYENTLKNAVKTAEFEFLRFYKDQKPPNLFKITNALGNLSAIPSILKKNQNFLISCSTKQGPSFAMVFFETGSTLASGSLSTGAIMGGIVCPTTREGFSFKYLTNNPSMWAKYSTVATLRNSCSIPSMIYDFSNDPTANKIIAGGIYATSRVIDSYGNQFVKDKKLPKMTPALRAQIAVCVIGSFGYNMLVRGLADKIKTYTN